MTKHEKNEKRNELRHALPALAMRIFALRGKTYPGYGFHYGMEKTIGGLLRRLNNFDEPFNEEALDVCDIIYRQLVEDVEKAEAKAQPAPKEASLRNALVDILSHPEAKVCKHWAVLQILNAMPENVYKPSPEFIELVEAINNSNDERAIELLQKSKTVGLPR